MITKIFVISSFILTEFSVLYEINLSPNMLDVFSTELSEKDNLFLIVIFKFKEF